MSGVQAETTEVLQALVRFNTVNPPGNERPAIEYLEAYLREAGFFTELLGAHESRPNLVATLDSGEPGPVMLYLGHLDTVLASADEWTFDPWSGEISGNHLWGRGALDMKSQVAAEAVAAASLAREGWRPARGALKLVFVVDEETGGALGARWLTEQHPEKVRCDLLLNEGGGAWFDYGGRRLYGLCCGEKSVIRFEITARGAAGHASMPRAGDNALLKLAPVLSRLATNQPGFDLHREFASPAAGAGRESRGSGRSRAASAPGRAGTGGHGGADAGGDPDPDDGPRLGQDQRDPITRAAEGRLPGTARPGGGRGGDAAARGAGRRGGGP